MVGKHEEVGWIAPDGFVLAQRELDVAAAAGDRALADKAGRPGRVRFLGDLLDLLVHGAKQHLVLAQPKLACLKRLAIHRPPYALQLLACPAKWAALGGQLGRYPSRLG